MGRRYIDIHVHILPGLERGCMAQVIAGSLSGVFGEKVKGRAVAGKVAAAIAMNLASASSFQLRRG